MASVSIEFSKTIRAANLNKSGVLVVGKHVDLNKIRDNLGVIEPKFGNAFDRKHFLAGLDTLSDKNSDSVELWLKSFALATLPSAATRHNAPMQPYALSEVVKNFTGRADEEYVVIVCPREHAFASGCVVPRMFPLYDDKTELAGKTPKTEKKIIVEFIFTGDAKEPLTDDEILLLQASSESIRLTAKIVDTPCNKMHTNVFLDEIRLTQKNLKESGHEVELLVIQGEELNEKGFGGIYGVGKAAINEPALAVLSYKPKDATQTIAWCGKGIVYDTGGLSIKDKNGMPGMKRDCGGAAGVLGAFSTAVKVGFQQNLHAVLCLAENAVGPKAARPDDVHTLYSGLTVEINNTDAEGRLVLGDGVAFAKKDLGADIIVDMATLTGAQGISTGQYHAAILTNNEDWEQGCMKAGRISGDLVFPVPYTPELHFQEFKSVVADMKNSVKNRSNAQVSCAGLFIGSHIGFDFPGVWLHVDMAFPVEFQDERATGYGVALLVTLFGQYTNNKMLQAIAPTGLKA